MGDARYASEVRPDLIIKYMISDDPNTKYDNNGDLILNKMWLFNSKSDTCEIEFINWCQNFYLINGYKPNGVVIGAHTGISGEWA